MDILITACIVTACSQSYGFYINSDTIVMTNHGALSDETSVGHVVWRNKDADIALVQASIQPTSFPECDIRNAEYGSNNLFIKPQMLWWSRNGWVSGDSGRGFWSNGKLVGINSGFWSGGERDGMNFGVTCDVIRSTLTAYLYSFYEI